MTRSIDSSRKSLVIARRSERAVSRAASLMTLARSAPVKPGVRRATESRSTSGWNGLPLGVHPQDRLAALHVRSVDGDLPVEAARAQQSGVEDVRPVGRGDQDHAALGVEAVHLHEQLVERLLVEMD